MNNRFDHTLKHKPESKPDAANVRRIELITGGSQRRRWSTEDKARIVRESLKPRANVSEVARRHGLRPHQLYKWRRSATEALARIKLLYEIEADIRGLPPELRRAARQEKSKPVIE